MAEPARKPRPATPPEGAPAAAPPAPCLRPRSVRTAAQTDPSHPSEALRLQDRVARAFTTPTGGKLEGLLIKLIIVAATCLVLRTVIVGGVGAFPPLR